jgi:uncharacterized membrane protein (UPF0127 family)
MTRAVGARGLGLAALLLAGPALAGEANPPLERVTVVIGGRVQVSAEVARTDRQRELGLSNRPTLGEGEGMLFLFGGVGPASIWMKEMRFPLDILWIKGGRIVMIKDRVRPMRPDRPPEVFTAEAEAVLEVLAGFAAAKGIAVGETVGYREAGAAGLGGNR